MTVQQVITYLNELSPLSYAEDFDNVGLLVGDKNQEVTGILVSLDTLESIVDEAIEKKCNMIVSFHPIIFSAMKRITGQTYVERVVMKALRYGIAIFSLHTALDNSIKGVNYALGNALMLKHLKILIPQKNTLRKLVVYVPVDYAEKVRNALFEVGAGCIGNYSECSFSAQGVGTFKANDNAQPFVGKVNEQHQECEQRVEIVFHRHMLSVLIERLKQVHPYQEVAYDILSIENESTEIGMGMIGELPQPMSETEFLTYLKDKLSTPCIRHSSFTGKIISRVAVLGGSGAFAIGAALQAKVDAYVSSDFSYHEFYKAENQILLADVGHYESEQFTKNLIFEYLREKIPNFAVFLSNQNTNPINYF